LSRLDVYSRIAVAVFVRAQMDSMLRTVLEAFQVVRMRCFGELQTSLASGAVRIALIDPALLGPGDRRHLALIRLRHPGVALIAYTSLDGPSLRAVARMVSEGHFFHRVLLHERDCTEYAIFPAIQRAGAQCLVNQVLGPLEGGLSALPQSVNRTIVDLFCRPSRYSTVCDLATESEIKVHTLYREFRRAGIATPRKFLTLAKMCHACFLLRESNASVTEVAVRVGYDRASTLTESCLRIFGRAPSGLRCTTEDGGLAKGMLDWLHKPTSPNRAGLSQVRGKLPLPPLQRKASRHSARHKASLPTFV
jgi:AraC-like DNA-binding protein